MKDIFKIAPTDQRIESGRILVASPELDDCFFRRSVILITDHSSRGSMGFMLNKATGTPVSEVLPKVHERNGGLHLMLGGPVEYGVLNFIHMFGRLIPGSQRLSHSLYWGGDFNAMARLLDKELVGAGQVKFFVGYAGWGAGQLEQEMNDRSWAITDPRGGGVFAVPEGLWEDAVDGLGQRYAIWRNYPESPDLN